MPEKRLLEIAGGRGRAARSSMTEVRGKSSSIKGPGPVQDPFLLVGSL